MEYNNVHHIMPVVGKLEKDEIHRMVENYVARMKYNFTKSNREWLKHAMQTFVAEDLSLLYPGNIDTFEECLNKICSRVSTASMQAEEAAKKFL